MKNKILFVCTSVLLFSFGSSSYSYKQDSSRTRFYAFGGEGSQVPALAQYRYPQSYQYGVNNYGYGQYRQYPKAKFQPMYPLRPAKRRDLPVKIRRADRAERNLVVGRKLPRKYRTCSSDIECTVLPEQGCALKCRYNLRPINKIGLENMLNSASGPRCMSRYLKSARRNNSCDIIPVCTKRGYCDFQ